MPTQHDQPPDHQVTLNAQDARGGKELGVMRYVLYISLGLSALAGVILWNVFFN